MTGLGSKGRLIIVGMGAVLLTSAYHRLNSPSVMADAANAFLASLTPEQRERAAFDFKDDERYFWHFIPSADIPKRYNRPRKGLPLREMTPPQKHLAQALLNAGLSQRGYIKATTVMSLEDILKQMEKDTAGRRDPDLYFFSVFGKPSEKGTWGYRVEGHHVSLHFTVVNGKVVGSPTFFGANPAEIRQGPRQGLRALAREEDLARELLNALSPEQRKVAIVSAEAYKDILTEASRKAALTGQPSGLPAAKLNAKQRELLNALVEEYAWNLPEPLAVARMDQLKKAGNNLHFAWAGSTEKGGPHYYRVQAQSFLIEYDNTQNGANHIHSVWRDFDGDWGQDLLKQHYSSSH